MQPERRGVLKPGADKPLPSTIEEPVTLGALCAILHATG